MLPEAKSNVPKDSSNSTPVTKATYTHENRKNEDGTSVNVESGNLELSSSSSSSSSSLVNQKAVLKGPMQNPISYFHPDYTKVCPTAMP